MTSSARFPGFEQESTSASLMVNQLEVPASDMLDKLTPEALATRGMLVQESENIEFLGAPALLMRLLQKAGGIEFEKVMLVFGDGSRTVMLVAAYPSVSSAELREPMKKAVLSARWVEAGSNPTSGPNLDGLNFSIEESDNLKVSQRIVNGLLLTLDGAQPPQPPTAPFLIVAPSIVKISSTEVSEVATHQLLTSRDFTEVAITSEEELSIDGLPAYEITATAKDAKSGEAVALYQLMLLETSQERYFRVLASVDRYKFERWLPEFRSVGRSLRRR